MSAARYRVASTCENGYGDTFYIGAGSAKAWDTFRLKSATHHYLFGRGLILSRWNGEALAGMGMWETVQWLPARNVHV